ncbi:alkaline phosphatase family protein [Novipirellula artificiosorum]|uniref:hypothetical protein n=1 Tax=Novipirellula artificiosorum TaxID=2528016 RepID=UPI0018CFA3B9|nr:hypothetical protein [Novipirellula artificiosorum]
MGHRNLAGGFARNAGGKNNGNAEDGLFENIEPNRPSLDNPATILDLVNHPIPSKYQGAALTPFVNGVELLPDREVDPTQLVDVAVDPEYKAMLGRRREKCMNYKDKYTRPGRVEE